MTDKENSMSQREYWASLSRSFDRRFIDKARRKHGPRTGPQAHRYCENGIKNTENATTVREGAHIRPKKGNHDL